MHKRTCHANPLLRVAVCHSQHRRAAAGARAPRRPSAKPPVRGVRAPAWVQRADRRSPLVPKRLAATARRAATSPSLRQAPGSGRSGACVELLVRSPSQRAGRVASLRQAPDSGSSGACVGPYVGQPCPRAGPAAGPPGPQGRPGCPGSPPARVPTRTDRLSLASHASRASCSSRSSRATASRRP